MTSSNGNIFRVTGLLCGEFTGDRWIPCTMANDATFDLRLNKPLSNQSWDWWFETPSCSLWLHCNATKSGPEKLKSSCDTAPEKNRPDYHSSIIFYVIHIYICCLLAYTHCPFSHDSTDILRSKLVKCYYLTGINQNCKLSENERQSLSDHPRLHCLLNSLTTKKTKVPQYCPFLNWIRPDRLVAFRNG